MILNSNDTSNKNNNNMSNDSDNEFSSKSNSLNTNIKAPSPISISAQSDAESLEMEAEPQNNFLCSFCSKKYLHRQSLQRHINKTHPKEKEKQIHLLKLSVKRNCAILVAGTFTN